MQLLLTCQCFQESLFSGLIPETSAKALSKYTEMVDVTTRELLDKLANATDNARIRLMVRGAEGGWLR